ncbi:ergothioneine biosynthesis protein EgtB [Oligoflexus tunisiensis]|uniref:ergothioneine biosynthesis protein EgtB n=1 Tax=Oligoflexus tunisiensis TaxID=708132 RepID=UPI000A9C131C|nr:ergothioneine biosynthesis protein EgtB [Oligoflexus tunisiensis]
MKPETGVDRLNTLLESYLKIRRDSEKICEGLSAEDCQLQAMPDVSPPKWHLAHTSWFFERFLLRTGPDPTPPIPPLYDHLFNSYYETAGSFPPRAQRGLLSRPGLDEVIAWRHDVDRRILELSSDEKQGELHNSQILEIGLHHEQQHQELLLTDIKYNFFMQPFQPALGTTRNRKTDAHAPALRWERLPEGVHTIGHVKETFAFDNERPAHRIYINPVALASRPATNGEYLDFIRAGGYRQVELWLSEGWNWVRAHHLQQPLYWHYDDHHGWRQFTLHGWESLAMHEPVCHLSYFEADAFARWCGARLPTEQEWEVFARRRPLTGHFFDFSDLHPAPAHDDASQVYGDVWEWTSSSYAPYPGYQPLAGSLGEYNGKFMVNQYVLRGGSCATPWQHIRPSYRNFFPATARWQFTGVRLAKDLL